MSNAKIIEALAPLRNLTAAELEATDRETIQEIFQTYKNLYDRKTALSARAFRKGSHVVFPLRDGSDVVARVDKVNRKTIGVSQVGFSWRSWNVSPSLCRVATDEEVAAATETAKEDGRTLLHGRTR